jgi:hypothetical protein
MFAWLDKWKKAREEKRRRRAPRIWIFVHAYGPQQATPDFKQSFAEALDFVRHALNAGFVRVDWENSIIFFDARKPGG